jgi:hypothetical protein
MTRGKALGVDKLPDNIMNRQEVAEFLQYWLPKCTLNPPPHFWDVRGVLLTKKDKDGREHFSLTPPPHRTRLLAVSHLLLRGLDKSFYIVTRNHLNSKIGSYQHGFIQGRSCWTAHLKIFNHLYSPAAKDQQRIIILIDIRRAFDGVNRQKLFDLVSTHFRNAELPYDWTPKMATQVLAMLL